MGKLLREASKVADFQPAVQNTEIWEGGYANSPSDSGGETYRGISRVNFPNWSGWTLIDAAKNAPLFPRSLDANSVLQAAVVSFYQTNFWHYNGINSQAIANKVFDLCVNMGSHHGITITQLALNSLGVTVRPDGVYGPGTEAAINATPPGSLLPSMKLQAEKYYEAIVVSHPEDSKFLADWIRRADA